MDNKSFFSLDRLVEFGLGMGVARQMVNVMNESIQSMHTPGAQNPMQSAVPKTYYVVIDGSPVGPLNDSELMQLIAQKRVDKNTLTWMPGMSAWKAIENVPEVLKVVALTPPPLNDII